jgi:transcriptional regulator with XRE-family HTH domain
MTSSKDPTSLALGSLLREYREWAGYSRDAVAERVGISADQFERWEIVSVPLPLSKRFLAVAEFLDIDESTVEAALAGAATCDRIAGPPRYLPHDPIEVYEAAPELEEAIAVHGWTAEGRGGSRDIADEGASVAALRDRDDKGGAADALQSSSPKARPGELKA